jgi:2,4-dienoyl-CoA reductase-like NADH-dependent reductase (Old Yellow Enzyme family)
MKLFEPGNIGTMELKNRIVMSLMGTRFCGLWGKVTDTLIEWYVRRARGGTALVVVEVPHIATAVK